MKRQKNLLIGGLIVVLIGVLILIYCFCYDFTDVLMVWFAGSVSVGAFLVGASIGHNSSDNTYLIKTSGTEKSLMS